MVLNQETLETLVQTKDKLSSMFAPFQEGADASEYLRAVKDPDSKMAWGSILQGDPNYFSRQNNDSVYTARIRSEGPEKVEETIKDVAEYVEANLDQALNRFDHTSLALLAVNYNKKFQAYQAVLETGDINTMRGALVETKEKDDAYWQFYLSGASDENITKDFQSHMMVEQIKEMKKLKNKETDKKYSKDKAKNYIKKIINESDNKEAIYGSLAKPVLKTYEKKK